MKPHNPEYEQKSVMFHQAESNFQGDMQEDFKSLVQETAICMSWDTARTTRSA